MTFSQKLRGLSQPARVTVYLHTVFGLSEAVGELFMNLFLWKATESLTVVALYNLAYWGALMLGFIGIGYTFKNKGVSLLYRLGFVGSFLFYLLVVALRTEAVNHIIGLGVLGGLAGAFYWAGYEVMVLKGTSDTLREMFYGVQGSLSALARIVGPLAAGALISFGGALTGSEFSGYYFVFGLLALIFLVSEMAIRQTRLVTFEEFRLRGVFSLYKERKVWRLNLWRSFTDGALISRGFVWGVLSYVILQSEFRLGAVLGIFGALGIVTNSYIGHVFKPSRRMVLNTVGMVILVMAGIIYPLLMNGTGLVIDQLFGESIGYPLLTFAWVAFFFLAVETDKAGKKRQFEYFVGHEIWQGVGRILSIGIFIVLLGQFDQIPLARIWFAALSFLFVVIWYLVKLIRQEALKEGYVEE